MTPLFTGNQYLKRICVVVLVGLSIGCQPAEGDETPYVRLLRAPDGEQPDSRDLGVLVFVDVSEGGDFVALRVDGGVLTTASSDTEATQLCVAHAEIASHRLIVNVRPNASESLLFAVLFDTDDTAPPGNCPTTFAELAAAVLPIRLPSDNVDVDTSDAGVPDAGNPDA